MTTTRRPVLLLPLLGALLALVLAACGGSGNEDASPTSVVPAGVPIYVDVTVRPEGDLRADFDAAAGKVLRTQNPSAQIRKLVDETLREEDFSYAKDVQPWLGRRAGAFLTDFSQDGAQGAVVLTTSDTGATLDALEKSAEGELQDSSVAGSDYSRDDEGNAFAAVEDVVVAGTEGGVRAAIEATEQGKTLEGSRPFTRAREAVSPERLALGWINLGTILDVAAKDPTFPRETLGPLRQLLVRQGAEGVTLALSADGNAVRVDAAALARPQEGAPDPAAAAQMLRSAPGDAFAAIGLADLGGQITRQLELLGQSGAVPGGDPQALLEGLGQQLGINVERDLLAWMGDGVLFARGSGLDIGGALVVESSDPAATRRGIAGIRRLLRATDVDAEIEEADVEGAEGLKLEFPDLPAAVFLVTAGDRFVAAVGESSLQAAIDPDSALGEAEGFRQATSALGGGVQPALYVDVATVADLLAAFAGAAEVPEVAQALRYLEAFTGLAAGGQQAGDVQRFRLALRLR